MMLACEEYHKQLNGRIAEISESSSDTLRCLFPPESRSKNLRSQEVKSNGQCRPRRPSRNILGRGA